jgi:hypothetical protein
MNQFWKEYWANFKQALAIMTLVVSIITAFVGVILITGYLMGSGNFLLGVVFAVLAVSAGAAALATLMG